MFLAMIKRAVKATLHQATEEWALEIGIPHAAVAQQRTSRLARRWTWDSREPTWDSAE